LKIKRE